MADLNFLDIGKKKQDAPEKKRKVFSFARKKKRAVGVNLITSEAQKEATHTVIRKNIIQLVVSFLVALILALLVYGGVLLYGQQEAGKVAVIRQQLVAVEQDIERLEKENRKLLGFQNKLTAIKTLLDSHASLIPFFDALEKNTLPDVSYDTLALRADGSVSLSAATTNYTTLGRQLLAFERSENFVTTARFSSIAASLDQLGAIIGIRFTVALNLDPKLLRPQPIEEK
ncbi:MAG: hypothetical protein AAB855_01615 [Patescibacteria group bacterium]